ncbi:MAG: AAA family ATPase [Gemmatimonadaceae bacterium]|nr:AAA family ATPase [Gemmatimonadaceae bacterium]
MTPKDRIPTLWDPYNLESTPFLHTPLDANDSAPHPLSLFVGRQRELHLLRENVVGAGRSSSRQAIAGAPGVGKTTLVKELKAQLHELGYLTTDTIIPILAQDDLTLLFGRIVSALYDTIVANQPHSAQHPALEAAETLVRSARIPYGGAGVNVLGLGLSASRGTTVIAAKDVRFEGPRVAHDLAQFVLGTDAHGVVLHLDNLENLVEHDAGRAADLLRDLRDIALTHRGLHFLLTGTPEAIAAAIDRHPQLRSHFEVHHLEPLSVAEVHELLARRYAHLRRDPTRPAIPPVASDVVEELYALYRGDLRGLLQALDAGVRPLLGLNAAGGDPRPADGASMRAILRQRYGEELRRRLDATRARQLIAWGEHDPSSTQTQSRLMALWGLKSQGSTSTAVNALIEHGYVIALPREGRTLEYVLTGVSRLIFG